MKTNTTFLPGFPTKLHGKQRRRQLEAILDLRRKALGKSISDLGVFFQDILPVEWMSAIACDLRSRLFPQTVVFWAWIGQVLDRNSGCGQALTAIQDWYVQSELAPPAFDTSNYCKGRQRLSDDFLSKIHDRTSRYLEARIRPHHCWRGHRLKAIDGTSIKLLDTPENQKEYPRASGQTAGCGFPVMGVVGVLDLACGSLSDYVICPHTQHDSRGFYDLKESFIAGDIVIGDRAFCSYNMMALLSTRQVESVMRLHQRRNVKSDWKAGQRAGRDSRLVIWKKSSARGRIGLSDEEWKTLPNELEVRYLRMKARGRDGKMRTIYLATTLLDNELYPEEEIALLYAERWKIEVKFRDMKTTMGFEMIRVKSPVMARRSLRMIQIAYNLIKAVQMEALQEALLPLDEIGFKSTLDLIREKRKRFAGLALRPRLWKAEWAEFEERIRERVIPIRPGRQEPRAQKQRPKPYQLLTAPRHEFHEIPHRERYRAAA